MPVQFQQISKVQSAQNFKKRTTLRNRKTFVYSKRNSDLEFQQMYEALNQNVASLVQQNRTKLILMNSTRSKDLVNKTQIKLVNFLKSKPGRKTYYKPTSTQRGFKGNIHIRNQQGQQKAQQIFDLNKLEQILKSYQKNNQKQNYGSNGILAQKIIKLADRQAQKRPHTHRILNTTTSLSNQISKNYLGWNAEKSKRRLKHLFI